MAKEGPWPTVKREPSATYLTADGCLRSGRSLAGPLRLGTSPGVGPRGASLPEGPGGSDFGVDRVSPRGFDPFGTPSRRAPDFPSSELVSTEYRGRRLDQDRRR